MSKSDFASFKLKLQKTLYNLYNPIYEPDDCIYEVTGCPPAQGLECIRSGILEAINEMGAGDSLPSGSKSYFDYKLLVYRFVELHSQEQASEFLNISPRHLRRKQQEAVVALALKMWQKRYPYESLHQDMVSVGVKTEVRNVSGGARVNAFLHEIEILNAGSPRATANLSKVVHKAVEMMAYAFNDERIKINVLDIPPNLETSQHPMVLREIILYTIECISQTGYSGILDISSRSEAGSVIISLATHGAEVMKLHSQVDELIGVLGGKIHLRQYKGGSVLDILFPETEKVHVLVVDDNVELVGLYRRFVANTCYEVIPLPSGSNLLNQINIIKPDVIVMDILLPGVDGWDLLQQLHQNFPQLSIPVVICSVIGNEYMAKSMGASGYLTKPIERKSFIEMLDKVCAVKQ